MAFDISQFVQQVAASNGFLSPAHFQVQIIPPPALLALLSSTNTSAFATTAGMLPFFCEAAQIPGVELATSNIHRYGYGPVEKKPYAVNFSEVNLRFLGDGMGEIWNFFQAWIKLIVNFDARNSINTATSTIAGTTSGTVYPYEIAYKEDYAIDLAIYIYDKASNKTISLILREAYPLFLGDIKLEWMGAKEIMKIPVTFTFVDWYNEMLAGGSVVNYNTIVNTLDAIMNLNITPTQQDQMLQADQANQNLMTSK
ncbi:MAG: hypothetical protein P4L79_09875 [Legionella sp.]|uniref:hypothetical protein n=1 Tax=Legionella sp. TaxID=459 RepID=UPI00283F9EA2|nr:hypothetical protein [Legionella sp.]